MGKKDLAVKQSEVLKVKQAMNTLQNEQTAIASKHSQQIKALNTNISKLKKVEKENKAKLSELKSADTSKELKKCKKEATELKKMLMKEKKMRNNLEKSKGMTEQIK